VAVIRLGRAGRVWARLAAVVRDGRRLDRLGAVKVKLAVLVGASAAAIAVVLWSGLICFGWLPRCALPAAIMVSLVVTRLLAHGVTSPLRDMTVAARAMARGDYSRRVQATSREEVGQLARAFIRMAAGLEEVGRARRELVANVSHGLRAPISALQAVLENAVDGVAQLPEPQRSCSLSSVADTLSRDLPWHRENLASVRAGRLLKDRPVVELPACGYPPAR
jgi:methyl-accepting chemotaxis protein